MASAGPTNSAMLLNSRRQGVGLLDLRLRHRLRQQSVGGGAEERLGGAEQRLDHDELPDPELAGDDQGGEQRVQGEAREVGHDHHAMARQAVGPHAADQHEADQRQGVRSQHQAEVGRAAGQIDHEQGEGDGHDAVADHARRLGEPQEAEIAVPENSQ